MFCEVGIIISLFFFLKHKNWSVEARLFFSSGFIYNERIDLEEWGWFQFIQNQTLCTEDNKISCSKIWKVWALLWNFLLSSFSNLRWNFIPLTRWMEKIWHFRKCGIYWRMAPMCCKSGVQFWFLTNSLWNLLRLTSSVTNVHNAGWFWTFSGFVCDAEKHSLFPGP